LGKYLTLPTPDPSVKTIDKEISPKLKVRIYTPPDYNVDKPKPVALSFHGGGWAMGDLDAEDIQFPPFQNPQTSSSSP
jgi:versiconal hemiacetal acetate esterase